LDWAGDDTPGHPQYRRWIGVQQAARDGKVNAAQEKT